MLPRILGLPLVLLTLAVGHAAEFFVAPSGSDSATGTIDQPFATLMRAQAAASTGDTVRIRGGTYLLDNSHISRDDGLYVYVNDFTKPGIAYLAHADEVPVFDFTAVKPVARRVTAFFIRTNDLHFRGLHSVGVQVTIRSGEASNTQSENFRIRGGSRNRLERLTLRDGMGIGVYITHASADNLVLNCDAYNNFGLDSLSMGNVDGFGAHTTATGTGNVFRGCRAWLNSDDGFDLINCAAPTLIENCWAAFSGYRNAALQSGGDGNGFKAGGYGRNGSTLPNPVPRHGVRFSLAIHNRASGFYANHHPGGLDFLQNTAYRNSTNYNFLNVLADNLTDVPGYGHVIRNNLSHSPRSTAVSNLDAAACDLAGNSFTLGLTVTDSDFLETTTATATLLSLLSAPRKPDGSLPDLRLLRPRGASPLVDSGVPLEFPYRNAAPDIGCFEVSPYEQWIGSRITGTADAAVLSADADPDGDGVANLLEFFGGTAPASGNARTPLALEPLGASGLRLTALQAKAAAGLLHVVEFSPNLGSWSPAAFSLQPEEDLGTHLLLAHTLSTPGPGGFWRLRVSEPSQ